MTRKLQIQNFKGGVGKTTTAVNLSHGLALKGRRVLLIDLDQQGNASDMLGVPDTAFEGRINDEEASDSELQGGGW